MCKESILCGPLTPAQVLLPTVGCCLTIIRAMKSLSCLQGEPGKAGTASKLHTTEQPAQLFSVLEANDLTEMMSMVGYGVLLTSSHLYVA